MKNPFRLFCKPSPLVVAKRDLEEAQRDYLKALQHTEYYAAQASYNKGLILRLTKYIKEQS